jgi:uncharacterized repeat protein (TIGR03803 family)
LYGTTGGLGFSSGNGTVFRVNPDGSDFTTLYSFTGGNDGAGPRDLVLLGQTLYGTAETGNSVLSNGTLFSISADGTRFTILHSFSGNSDGANPQAGLFLSGNTLYGTTQYGGSSGNGTVFVVRTNGAGYTNLYGFSNGNSDGANPAAGLILSGDVLFGTTANGGSADAGIVFAVTTDGTGFTNLYSFTDGNDGAYPAAGLVLSGNSLYGTTSSGGSEYGGTVFAIHTDGTGLTNLHSFDEYSGDGSGSVAGLILSGNTLYGTTEQGGINGGYGTVFAVNTDGTGYTSLYGFGNDGANPVAGLVLSGSTLYGTMEYDQGAVFFEHGPFGGGTVFAVNTNGTDYTNLCYGANPVAGLVLSGNTLFGTMSDILFGGAGTVFKVSTDGTGFTNVYSFAGGNDGANPQAGLILAGNTLYGTAYSGGSKGHGTVFAVNTDGTGFTTLHSFTGGSDGANPKAGLILSGNTLFGTTSAGGSSGEGTVFSLSLPSPQLTITPLGANVLLTWPAILNHYTLESATNLVPPVIWSLDPTAPVVIAGQIVVANPITGSQMFFRLQQN